MWAVLRAIFVVIGTIVGAGFASGQEIWLFFNCYGNWGILGIVVACVLSGFLIYQIFSILQKKGLATYADLLRDVSKTEILNKSISMIVSFFLIISFYIMVAGMSAYFNQEFGIPTWICSIVMAVLCYITLQKDIKGIVIVNSVLIPCLVLFILYLGLKNMSFGIGYFSTPQITGDYSWKWLWSSILYASYNSITFIPMVVELKPYINSKNKAKIASVLCTIILILVGICLFSLLLRSQTAYQAELPMLEAVKEFGTIYSCLYGVVVVVAIFTSAISAGYGFLKNEVEKRGYVKGNIQKRKGKFYKKLLFVMCAIAPIIANFGFSNLVSRLYPMFGVLGLIQMILVFKSGIKNSACKQKTQNYK